MKSSLTWLLLPAPGSHSSDVLPEHLPDDGPLVLSVRHLNLDVPFEVNKIFLVDGDPALCGPRYISVSAFA